MKTFSSAILGLVTSTQYFIDDESLKNKIYELFSQFDFITHYNIILYEESEYETQNTQDKMFVFTTGRRCYGYLEIDLATTKLFEEYKSDIKNLCSIISIFLENRYINQKRKKARKKLTEESAKYKLLAENASDIISRLTLNGVFTYISPSCTMLLGYNPEELINKNLYDYTAKDMVNDVKSFHIAILQNQIDGCLTHKFRKISGEYIWLESHIKIVKDEHSGNLLEMIAVSRDITERKKLELLKEQAEITMKQLINATSDAMCMLEPNGTVLYANETTLFRLQTPYEQIVGKNLFDFFPQSVREYRKIKFFECVETKLAVKLEDVRSGRNIDQTFYPIVDSNNEIIKVAYYGYDVTEQKKTQESLDQTQKVLKEVNKKLKITLKQKSNELTERDSIMLQQSRFASMGEMLSMIAHQWRQPLNAVSAANINVKMFFDMGTLNSDLLYQQCDFIEEQTQRMSKTINDFMEFFRPNKEKQLFNINDAITCVLNIIESQLKNRSINVVLDVDKTASIVGRKNEFEHVVLNILSNARDAIESTNSQKREIAIVVTHKSTDNVLVQIKDSGGGIDSTIIDRIFDPYFTTKSALNGTGIGLYMSKIIINKNFHGTIAVQNHKYGAMFEIMLPKNNERTTSC